MKMAINPLEEQDFDSILPTKCFRYNLRQSKIQLTISEPRPANIFEEFVLKSAIKLNPSTSVNEIAKMLCIDPLFINNTVKNLQDYKILNVGLDSKININYSAQKLFIDSNCILEPYETKEVYYIDDPLAGGWIHEKSLVNAPQRLVSLNDHVPLSWEYKDIKNLTLSQIREVVEDAGITIDDNKQITDFTVIDKTLEVRRKITIGIIQTSPIQFQIQEKGLESLSRQLTDLSQQGRFNWEELFSQSERLPLYPSVSIRADAPDAESIRNFVQAREIRYLVHFTSIENLQGICKEGAILSTQILRRSPSYEYNQIDFRRIDRRLNHICCSINYYNFRYHYRVQYKSYCWILLHIDPAYLWEKNTLFCEVNAATDSGSRIGQGLDKLKILFAEQVNDNSGIQNRRGKPSQQPTCVQAEVMIHESIALDDVFKIIVKNNLDRQRVREAGWEGEIEIRPDLFQPRFDWI